MLFFMLNLLVTVFYCETGWCIVFSIKGITFKIKRPQVHFGNFFYMKSDVKDVEMIIAFVLSSKQGYELFIELDTCNLYAVLLRPLSCGNHGRCMHQKLSLSLSASALKSGWQKRQPPSIYGAVFHHAFVIPASVRGFSFFPVLRQHPFQARLWWVSWA